MPKIIYIKIDNKNLFLTHNGKKIYSSEDGFNWIDRNLDLGHTNLSIVQIMGGENCFIKVCSNGQIYSTKSLVNVIWSASTYTYAGANTTSCKENGKFILIAGFNTYYSISGIEWYAGTILDKNVGYNSNYSKLIYKFNKYILATDSGQMYYSTDGRTWLKGTDLSNIYNDNDTNYVILVSN